MATGRRSATLAVYLGLTSMADGWAARKLAQRLADGKEHPERMSERIGEATIDRPPGPLVWFHAASVGESLSILELLRRVREDFPTLNVLVTTGTKTSASLMSVRLPDGVVHQFVPVDTKTAVNKFIAHWQPDLAIWTESEFWPRLMTATKRSGAPMVLVNGRISEKSADSWRWFRAMSRRLMGYFDLMLVQSEDTRQNFEAIGAPSDRLAVTGSLKEGSLPLPDDQSARKALIKQIGDRPVWLAASTHDDEELQVAKAHQTAVRHSPDLLLIIVPRHPERGDAIAADLRAKGMKVAQRSGREDVDSDTDIYLADTLGELGVFFRLAPISFIGGSLVPVGGHNPFEPAALGSAIIHGPHVHNFTETYARLRMGDAAIEVASADDLGSALADTMRPDVTAKLASAAWNVSSEGADVIDQVVEHLTPYLNAAQKP